MSVEDGSNIVLTAYLKNNKPGASMGELKYRNTSSYACDNYTVV
jgi:hypothetical protein